MRFDPFELGFAGQLDHDDDYTLDDARDDAAITGWEIRHDLEYDMKETD